MRNTPLNPLSRGDLEVSRRDDYFKWIPDPVRNDKAGIRCSHTSNAGVENPFCKREDRSRELEAKLPTEIFQTMLFDIDTIEHQTCPRGRGHGAHW